MSVYMFVCVHVYYLLLLIRYALKAFFYFINIIFLYYFYFVSRLSPLLRTCSLDDHEWTGIFWIKTFRTLHFEKYKKKQIIIKNWRNTEEHIFFCSNRRYKHVNKSDEVDKYTRRIVIYR